MTVGQPGGAVGFPRDDRLGQGGMPPQRPAAHLGRVRFGVEAEADLSADPRGQLGEPGVVRGAGDRLVQRVVRQPEASRPAARAYSPTARRIVSMSSADRRSAAVRAICCSTSRR